MAYFNEDNVTEQMCINVADKSENRRELKMAS